MPENINVFNYFNYHDYLADYYEFKKKTSAGFSHRQFMLRAGLTSPNYLLRVIQKQRKLSGKYTDNFLRAISLTGKEAEYFRLLVSFCNEKDVQTKESCLKKMFLLRYPNEEFRLEDRKLKFFQRWYYPVIRELAVTIDFKDNYNLLASIIIPKITAIQVKNAVSYLVENDFIIKKGANGRYRYTDAVISSGPEVQSAIVTRYHQAVLKQASEALQTIRKEDRDISSITLSVSTETYYSIKKEIQDFRKRLLSIAAEDPNPDMVCLAAFQLLPRSQPRKQP